MPVNGFLVDNVVQKYNYESLENYNTPDFSTSSTYQVGDYVMYQGKLYKCTTAITTSGAWDSTKWSLAILSDDVADLRSVLDEAIEDFAVPTQEAVDNWLTAHPEATTTVQDGSLTEAKFSDALKVKAIKDYVTPEMFGAKGDGVTDDTTAFQAAIDSGIAVYLGKATYKVNTLYLRRNVSIFGQGKNSRIQSTGNVFELDPNVQYISNINLSGFEVIGDNGLYFTSTTDCYAVTISDITFTCTDTCVYVEKGFQWRFQNIWLSGENGIVGLLGPGNTYENVYESNCRYMFKNCNGVFISINVSNSRTTEVVFDYDDGQYGHNIIVIGINAESVAGQIVRNISTNGFAYICFIGLNILNFNTSVYLFDLYNTARLHFDIREISPIADLTKFINITGGISQLKDFYINWDLPFAINGYAAKIPYNKTKYDALSYYPTTVFSRLESRLISGCVSPISEDVPFAYSITMNNGSLINLTPSSATQLAILRPFMNPIVGGTYFGEGTIVTIKNSTGADAPFSAAGVNYSFEASGRLAANESKSFILRNNGSNLLWHEI